MYSLKFKDEFEECDELHKRDNLSMTQSLILQSKLLCIFRTFKSLPVALERDDGT